MTFLELCQSLRQEAGYSGTGLPSTVTGQTGQLGRVVAWIRQADLAIQRLHSEWTFLRGRFTFDTEATVSEYTRETLEALADWPAPVDAWDFDTLRITDGEQISELHYLDPVAFRRLQAVSGRPRYVTRAMDGGLLLSPTPDDAYTVTGEFQAEAQEMTADADASPIPAPFHHLIVWQALQYYGLNEDAPDIIADSQRHLRDGLAQMRRRFLPTMRMAGPLA